MRWPAYLLRSQPVACRPPTKASYLASGPLIIAPCLAGHQYPDQGTRRAFPSSVWAAAGPAARSTAATGAAQA